MKYLAPFAVHSALGYSSAEELKPYLLGYDTLLRALVDDRLDLEAAAKAEKLTLPVEGFLKRPTLEAVRSEPSP